MKPGCPLSLTVIDDPGDYPLATGLQLSREEYRLMIAWKCFTPGTVLKDRKGNVITIRYEEPKHEN